MNVDLDISIAFDKKALTLSRHPLNYLCDHEPIVLKVIKEIRSKKKRPDVHSIYDYIMNGAVSNTNKTSIQTLIDNMIQKDEKFSRRTSI